MGTLDILAGARIERVGRQIHSQLVILRRRKLILSCQNTKPERNPALDPLLSELRRLRVRLDFQIRKVDVEKSVVPAEVRPLAHARDILGDAAELIDLLIWFGAEIPAHMEAEQDADSLIG